MNRQRLIAIGGIVLVAFVAVIIYALTRPAPKQPTSNSSSIKSRQTIQTPNLTIITTPNFVAADPNPNDSITTSSIYMVNITFSKIMVAPSDIKVTFNGRDVTVGKTQFISGGIGLHVSVEPWQIGTYQVDYLACPATAPSNCRQGRYSFAVE